MGTGAIRSLDQLGRLVAEKRGEGGLRATAAEIGIAPATLSRVEQGQLPDLANFTKICKWLGEDPSSILGLDQEEKPVAAVHFRKTSTMKQETAKALADMILAAQRAMRARQE